MVSYSYVFLWLLLLWGNVNDLYVIHIFRNLAKVFYCSITLFIDSADVTLFTNKYIFLNFLFFFFHFLTLLCLPTINSLSLPLSETVSLSPSFLKEIFIFLLNIEFGIDSCWFFFYSADIPWLMTYNFLTSWRYASNTCKKSHGLFSTLLLKGTCVS